MFKNNKRPFEEQQLQLYLFASLFALVFYIADVYNTKGAASVVNTTVTAANNTLAQSPATNGAATLGNDATNEQIELNFLSSWLHPLFHIFPALSFSGKIIKEGMIGGLDIVMQTALG